jgi:type IV pilus assembly protein PilA
MSLNSSIRAVFIISMMTLYTACSDNSVPSEVHTVIFDQSEFSSPFSLDPCDENTDKISQLENVAHRELISIDYTNKYEKNIDIPVTVYALTFTYRIVSDIPELPQIDQVFNGEGIAGLNPNNGKWELHELKLGDSDEGIIREILDRQYMSNDGLPLSEQCIMNRVSEGLRLADVPKLAIAETYTSTGKFSGSNAGYGMPEPTEINSDYIYSVAAGNEGKITVTYNDRLGNGDANNRTIIIAPITSKLDDSDQYWSLDQYWECRGGTMPDKFRPKKCRKNNLSN